MNRNWSSQFGEVPSGLWKVLFIDCHWWSRPFPFSCQSLCPSFIRSRQLRDVYWSISRHPVVRRCFDSRYTDQNDTWSAREYQWLGVGVRLSKNECRHLNRSSTLWTSNQWREIWLTLISEVQWILLARRSDGETQISSTWKSSQIND